jgi:signal transduction histidine kinase
MLLMNLVTNAIKYNDSDRPQIEIRFDLIGPKLFLHFEDNGIGFDKKEIRKIFKKFYQIGNVDNMTAKGSGIGLHLVQTIARIHKWKVFAKSEGIGKGSVFTIIIPAP